MRKNLGRLALIPFALAIISPTGAAQAPVVASGAILSNDDGASALLFTATFPAAVTAVQASTNVVMDNCDTLPQIAIMAGGIQFNLNTLTNGQLLWQSTQGLPYNVNPGQAVTAVLVT